MILDSSSTHTKQSSYCTCFSVAESCAPRAMARGSTAQGSIADSANAAQPVANCSPPPATGHNTSLADSGAVPRTAFNDKELKMVRLVSALLHRLPSSPLGSPEQASHLEVGVPRLHFQGRPLHFLEAHGDENLCQSQRSSLRAQREDHSHVGSTDFQMPFDFGRDQADPGSCPAVPAVPQL